MGSSIRPHFRRLYSTFTENQILQHTHVGFSQVDTYEANFELKQLIKNGNLSKARNMFDKMLHRDEISWTTLISGYVSNFHYSEALSLFSTLWLDPVVRIDPFALSVALKACGLGMNLNFGELLHSYSVKSGLVNSVFVGSSLLDMYNKFGKVWQGCRVFDEMPLRNVVSWTAIITGLVRAGFCNEGLFYFSEMWKSSVEYDSYTFAIALKACADLCAFNTGREIHTLTIKKGLDVTSFVANTLATMYNKCGKLYYGLKLFERMSIKDVVSWTTIIMTSVQTGRGEYAVEAFIKMRESGVIPNEYTFAAVIAGCASLSRIELGEQLHAHIMHIGLMDSLSVSNSIMTMYSKCGHLNLASVVFHEMAERDIVTWSTIIGGYSQGGHGEEAFELLSLMKREGPKPTEFALASVISVCGNMAILEQGKQLHAHVLSIGLDNTAMVQSALINMYSKCGSINEALEVFNLARDVDVISWTAMINGYAEHGYSQEAIDLFEKKSKAGLRPDSVTFIGVLAACSHAGLVDLGYHYFNSMSNKAHIDPEKEHYGCMIDLLCRAGRLKEAENMIKNMPCKKDDVVWSTLLRACRVYGDADCGTRAAEQVLKLDPNCAGTHITLANIYASKGRWEEVADVRMMMKSKGVIKEPGWSWIKIKDQGCAFVSGDRLHPEGEGIYKVLGLLASKTEVDDEEFESLLYDVAIS